MASPGGNARASLWTLDLSDPEAPRATLYLDSEFDLELMQLSPDGTLAAYRSDESGQEEVYIRSFPRPGQQTRISDGNGGRTVHWSPSGDSLYFGRPIDTEQTGGFWVVALDLDPVPVVISRDSLFALGPLSDIRPAALHPDGDRFLVTLAGDTDDEPSALSRPVLIQGFRELLRGLQAR